MVICLERGADLHMAQLMPLPLTIYRFSKIQIGFTFLVVADPGSRRKGPLNACVCVCVRACVRACVCNSSSSDSEQMICVGTHPIISCIVLSVCYCLQGFAFLPQCVCSDA